MTQEYSDDELIAGKYRVERTLGVGGMGSVYCAVHVQLGQRVAIKVMLPEHAERAESITRFLREGQAAVRLRSQHVGRVIDVGQMPTGAPYLVMEYYEGADLSHHLEQRGFLPVAEAVDLLLQASEAIAEAHTAGIIHRDLKPANLFLTKDAYGNPSLKVLDFGISKVQIGQDDLHGGGGSLTNSSAIMGSPLYMSPEQMKSSKDVDTRADIWALGVIFYEFLTGTHPFVGNTLSEICIRVATEPAPEVRESRPEVPQIIDMIIQRCLAKKPGDRYASVAEFARAIAPLGGSAARQLLQGVLHFSGTSQADSPHQQQQVDASALPKPPTEGSPESAKVQTDLSWLEGTAAGLIRTRSSAKLWLTLATSLFAAGLASAALWLWKHSADASPTPSASTVVRSNADAALGAPPAASALRLDASVAPFPAIPSASVPPLIMPKLPTLPIKSSKLSDKIVEKTTTQTSPHSPVPAVTASAPATPAQNPPEAKAPAGKLPAWGGRE